MSAPIVPTAKRVNPLLAKYLEVLMRRPVLTKAVTAAVLNFAGENIARNVTGAPPDPYEKTGIAPVDFVKANKRAFKLSAYGFFVSAPLAHFLVALLQKAFVGRTGKKAQVALLVTNNLTLVPIQGGVYLACLAILNGQYHLPTILKFVQSRLWGLCKTYWTISPLMVFAAQRFLANELWVPFFSVVNFLLGLRINIQVKRAQVASAKAKKEAEDKTKGL